MARLGMSSFGLVRVHQYVVNGHITGMWVSMEEP